ncbi:MAG: zf-HC2 domain-containing protein [Ignavibacteria bacterium]|nr:zf-HC2 domain-containing protein [Ignavibacteria bacterium]
MPAQHNLHWTSDEDLLERYVLGQVDVSERSWLEAHLHECVQCQQAVRAEQELAAGIREAGREMLKARLKERIAVQPLRRINWYQVAAAAATIVILVTVGIHNRWFFSDEVKHEVFTEQEQKEAAAPADKIEAPQEDRAAQTQPHGAVGEPVPAIGGTATTSKSEGRRDIAEEKGREPIPVTTEKRFDAGDQEPQLAADARRKRETAAPDRSAFDEVETWVEGRMISLRPAEPAADKFVVPQVARGYERLQARKEDRKLSKPEALIQADGSTAGIILEQKEIGDLSPAQQQRQKGDAIQTLIQRKRGTLVMTLYLDRPVSDSVLQAASVESVGADSVVVQLGSQLIGYKLPPAWSEVFIRQAKVKR